MKKIKFAIRSLLFATKERLQTLRLVNPFSPSISHILTDDPDMIFVDDDDNDDLGGFTYSPFKIRTESEDEVVITKGQLQPLHEKIEQLLFSSKASYFEAYSKATVESLFERITKEHADDVAKMNKVVTDYAEVCKTTTKKFDKLISDTTSFMEAYQSINNTNVVSTNVAL
ncbi:unnamed protein product [Lactuca saligna]|uniref:Uncharacterized protein n=1 Tax=Lactuca saligna TaxID=75948 RepID=A0AA36DZB9_LACSI|nr:unnamed protein product [Lactuca saligna]